MTETESPRTVQRRTWQRDAVRKALGEAPGFLSAQALHAQLSARGTHIGLATVYRALASLAASGEADSLQSGEGELVYRACDMRTHHHHLICRRCGAAVEIASEPVERWSAQVAAEHGYIEPKHQIDVFGICPGCQRAEPEQETPEP